MPLSTEDHIAVGDHLARYCWLVDSGDGPGWAALWEPDGVFHIRGREPTVGHDALAAVPRGVGGTYGGQMFHHAANQYYAYGETPDVVHAHMYNLICSFEEGSPVQTRSMARQRLTLVRNGTGWLIRHSDTELFRAT